MDNQPMNQMNQPSSSGKWYTIASIAVLVAIIAAIAAWYFYFRTSSAPTPEPLPTPAIESAQLAPLSGDTTTTGISDDLNQIPDTSAAMEQDLNSLDQSVNSF